jgi:hypothetical protein
MKTQFICAALLIIGMGAVGCGAVPEPPLACTEQEIQWGGHGGFSLQYCEALGMECNEAVTLADECPTFVDELEGYIREVLVPMIGDRVPFIPSFINIDELVAMLFEQYVGVCGEVEFLDEVGTCQPLGNEGDACAEDADCDGDLACSGGLCVIPETPECQEDADCLDDFACIEEVCVLPETPECQEDVDCLDDLVCIEELCVAPPPPVD